MSRFRGGREVVWGYSRFICLFYLFCGDISWELYLEDADVEISLAWAKSHLVVAALVQNFDFQFEGSSAEYFECESYQFTVETRGTGTLNG